MKTLIAIAGCHSRRAQADAQRQTWVRDVRGADVRFFAGGYGQNFQPDEVWLDCPDGYAERREKFLAILHWTLDQGYDYLWRLDDDIYCRPERLLALAPQDYQGLAVEFSNPYEALFKVFQADDVTACIGWVVGLSRVAMELLLEPDYQHLRHWYVEDIWTGLHLREYGILPHQLGITAERPSLIRCTHDHGVPNSWANQEPPLAGNEVVASCEYTPQQMREIHRAFITS